MTCKYTIIYHLSSEFDYCNYRQVMSEIRSSLVGVFILEGLFSHQLSPFGASDGKTGT
jgi:hypothetical protein